MQQLYPIPERALNAYEKFACRIGKMVGFCNICWKLTIFMINSDNLRETVICINCNSRNRQRQVAFILCKYLSSIKGKKVKSLIDLGIKDLIAIYNTEAHGSLHNTLKSYNHYYCSEYFGPDYKGGSKIGDIYHEDLMNLSLKNESIDVFISGDVFEHIPLAYKAHGEIYRVLKYGGRHIFTVPFYQNDFFDEERSVLKDDGQVLHLKPPEYHDDPIRPEGALVYRIFSLEMLCLLRKIGFTTKFYKLYEPIFGILGNNALVFEAVKT